MKLLSKANQIENQKTKTLSYQKMNSDHNLQLLLNEYFRPFEIES